MLNRRKQLRRTPFRKPSNMAKRQSYLRKVSGKKRKSDAMAKVDKFEWEKQWFFCWWCCSRLYYFGAYTIHHISKRSHGGKWEQSCNWFFACHKCNCGPLDSSDKRTQAMALMLKRRHDPEHFDLAEWNRIHTGGKGERITLAAVDAAEREMG